MKEVMPAVLYDKTILNTKYNVSFISQKLQRIWLAGY